MNSHDKTDAGYPEDDENVARLLQDAGRRAPLPDDVRDRMEHTFRAELKAARSDTPRRQMLAVGGLAASVLVAVLILLQPAPVSERPAIASVTRAHGDVTWQWQEVGGPLLAGTRIQIGDRVETGKGHISFTPNGSTVDIRLGEQTVVDWRDAHTVVVQAGVVYVDSDPSAEHFPLVLVADGLTVEHIGTQYMLTRQSEDFEVAVREGEIAVDYNGTKAVASGSEGQAELLRIGGQQTIERIEITPFDERWHWTTANAPALDTQDLPIREFFAWFSRQTGYTVDASAIGDEMLDETLGGRFITTDAFLGLNELLDTNPFDARINHERGQVVIVK